MNKNIIITIKKELRSIFRDKKTLVRLLIFPFIIPFMIIIYGEMFENLDNSVETYKIGINYQVDAPTEEILKDNNLEVEYKNNQEQLEEIYNNKEIDGYIIYDENTNTYKVYVDQSSNKGLSIISYIDSYFTTYNQYLTNIYLVEEGIDLETAYNHFQLEYEELNSSNYLIYIVISACVTYIIMSIVIATGNMATGASATERENGTLETIMTFPIKKNELILGKYYSSVIIGFIASLVAFILMVVSILIAKTHYTMFNEADFIINFPTIFINIITMLVASFFIGGIALALCSMSKSYKEAQSSVSFLNFITIIPLILSMSEVEVKSIYYLIPIFNHEQIMLDLFHNNLTYNNLLITIVSSIIYIIVVTIFIIKAYNSEKVLFSN